MCNGLKSGFGAFFRIWRIFLDFRRSRTRNWDLRCSRWAPMSMSTFKSRYFAMSSWNPYFLPQSAHGGRSWQNIRISECSCSWAPTVSTPRSRLILIGILCLSFHSLSQALASMQRRKNEGKGRDWISSNYHASDGRSLVLIRRSLVPKAVLLLPGFFLR